MSRTIKYIFFFIIILVIIFCLFYIYYLQNGKIIPEKEGFHASMYYYDNPNFFSESVKSFANVKPLSPPPHIFIVNQHILAAHVIANQFALSADSNVKTVVLITQNNWNVGQAPIIISRYGWKTPLGNIQPDTILADKLIKNHLASEEENIFAMEHGITGIIPYVAHSFPNAKVVTLVIRDYAPAPMIDSLATELSKLDVAHTVIVGTIDMSHYLPKYVADTHDDLTVQSIKEFDYQTLPRLDIDTVPTLRTVMKVAESKGMQSFVQTWHANSADIVGQTDLLSTTSYISGYFSSGTPKKIDGDIHLLFVGDVMFDRGVAEHAQKYGIDSLFAGVDRLFLGTHAVIGNLEGAITDQPSVSEKNPSALRFTFNPAFADLLAKQHFTALSSANNHALDFEESGYNQTRKDLVGAGLLSFGSPLNNENLSTALAIQGKNVCLVGYNDLFVPDPTTVINQIKNIRNSCAYVIVFAHWGVEYLSTETDRQKMLAHEFIDAGADIIIGAHPHAVEPIEIYKNKPIFYSLGNFLFDQNISFATEHGLALNIDLENSENIFTLVPVSIKNSEVQISSLADANKILSTVVDKNLLPNDIGDDILNKKQFILYYYGTTTNNATSNASISTAKNQ